MKFSKVAAVVAGSVAVMGAAAPAMAADGGMPPMSATGGITEVLDAQAPIMEDLGAHAVNGLNEQGSAVNTALEAVGDVNQARNQLPAEVLKTGNALAQATPMLGGLQLNGGK
ncbi:hypothetical protein [Streptomyces sp. NPDC097619]|uniref:hypothetical protein n=1 Tax=Streptomyces sp. NPDC097619 TaxID=3157228 RepID=UPI00331C74BC